MAKDKKRMPSRGFTHRTEVTGVRGISNGDANGLWDIMEGSEHASGGCDIGMMYPLLTVLPITVPQSDIAYIRCGLLVL